MQALLHLTQGKEKEKPRTGGILLASEMKFTICLKGALFRTWHGGIPKTKRALLDAEGEGT